jgi:hypothetical protein
MVLVTRQGTAIAEMPREEIVYPAAEITVFGNFKPQLR